MLICPFPGCTDVQIRTPLECVQSWASQNARNLVGLWIEGEAAFRLRLLLAANIEGC
jgi:hypothetical protein